MGKREKRQRDRCGLAKAGAYLAVPAAVTELSRLPTASVWKQRMRAPFFLPLLFSPNPSRLLPDAPQEGQEGRFGRADGRMRECVLGVVPVLTAWRAPDMSQSSTETNLLRHTCPNYRLQLTPAHH